MVTLSLRGYLKDTSTTLMRALPFDFTPSIGPGFGKDTSATLMRALPFDF